ncbi:MAG: hypothetical protein ACK559_38835, partial [bacterium]
MHGEARKHARQRDHAGTTALADRARQQVGHVRTGRDHQYHAGSPEEREFVERDQHRTVRGPKVGRRTRLAEGRSRTDDPSTRAGSGVQPVERGLLEIVAVPGADRR